MYGLVIVLGFWGLRVYGLACQAVVRRRVNKDFQTERGGNLDLKIRQNKGKIKVNGKGKGNTQGKMQRRQKGTQKGKRQNKGKTKGKEKVHQNNWKYVQRSYNRQKKGKSEGRKKVEKR